MKMINGFPRRYRVDLQTPVEEAIRAAVSAVEHAGAHQLLTDAVSLLIQAHEKVADFVELDNGTTATPNVGIDRLPSGSPVE